MGPLGRGEGGAAGDGLAAALAAAGFTDDPDDDDASMRPNVAYDHRRYGVRAGVDFMAGGESSGLGLGMSLHGLRGSAEMASVGEVDLSGAGVGVHATTMAGGIHVDVQAALTRYDVDLKSTVKGALNSGVKGQGFAVGVEKVLAVGAGMDSRLFGSLDVEQEFSKETEVKVSDTMLKTSTSPTRLHLAVGGDHRWGGGRYALRGSVSYAAGGGGNRDYGAGLDFTFRF